jgi:hypothetical protein
MAGHERATLLPQEVAAVSARFFVFQGRTQEEIYEQKNSVVLVLYTGSATTSPFPFLAVFTFGYNSEGHHALVRIFNTISELYQEGMNVRIFHERTATGFA